MKQRVISFFLALCLMIVMLPASVSAADPPQGIDSFSVTLERPTLNTTYSTSTEECGIQLRSAMAARQASEVVYLQTPYFTEEELLAQSNDILAWATVHTGVPNEGDYLFWNIESTSVNVDGEIAGDIANLYFTYEFTYFSTASQEEQLDEAITAILAELDIDEADDYTKVCSVYDWICSNVSYDGAADEDTPLLDYTAYGAWANGHAVSYGLASLFYRMALELGVDNRMFCGLVDNADHCWNIVCIDGLYYNLDAALDAGSSKYRCFLRSDANFSDHQRYEEYATEDIYEAYPMGAEDYTICEHTYDSGTAEPAATCTEDGLMVYTCTACGETRSEVIPAGHNYETQVVAPTCEESGYDVLTCTTCGETFTENYTGPLGHSYGAGLITTEATCTDPGVVTYTCSVCAAEYTEEIPQTSHDYAGSVCTICGAGSIARIYGDTRYETAFAIADAMKDKLGVAQFETIIIASGTSYADALSGSYLAAVKNAPILISSGSNNDDLATYVSKNLTADGTVYLLGGINALSAELEAVLEETVAAGTVKRLGGNTRYETNLLILEEADLEGQEILVCTGTGFADSLSASATKKPILLVGNSLTDSQKEFLAGSSGIMVIIGGTNAVSADMAKSLSEYGTVERIGGSTRYETSIMVAERFFNVPGAAVLAYSIKFPDGLCGGPLAVSMNAPLILTATGSETAAADYAEENGIAAGIVLGGPGLISDESVKMIFGMTEDSEIIIK